jgi:hypothetical protein
MAKFRCKASGNIIEFTYEVDIKSTRRNKAYEEVIEVIKEAPQDVKIEAPKKAGRPPKAIVTATTTEE